MIEPANSTVDISASEEREAEIIAGIRKGLADMQAGRLVSHEDAMRAIDTTIVEAMYGRESEKY